MKAHRCRNVRQEDLAGRKRAVRKGRKFFFKAPLTTICGLTPRFLKKIGSQRSKRLCCSLCCKDAKKFCFALCGLTLLLLQLKKKERKKKQNRHEWPFSYSFFHLKDFLLLLLLLSVGLDPKLHSRKNAKAWVLVEWQILQHCSAGSDLICGFYGTTSSF